MLLPQWVRWIIAGLAALIVLPPALLIAAVETMITEAVEMARVWWRYRPRKKA